MENMSNFCDFKFKGEGTDFISLNSLSFTELKMKKKKKEDLFSELVH